MQPEAHFLCLRSAQELKTHIAMVGSPDAQQLLQCIVPATQPNPATSRCQQDKAVNPE
jgi:hypothetical protein